MKLFPAATLWRCLFVFVMPFSASLTHAETNLTLSTVTGNNTFAWNLYAKLKSTPGNLFFSPYSISTCLGMTYVGAHDGTAHELSKVFSFNTDQTAMAADFAALQKGFQNSGTNGPELNIANGIWARDKLPLQPAFVSAVQNQFLASIKAVDFSTQSEAVRTEVNAWVSDKTKGKISDLFGPHSVAKATRMLLVNAIYFKGVWRLPFKTGNTHPDDFHIDGAKTVSVPFMNQQTRFDYAEAPACQILKMPYRAGNIPAGPRLSMVILLPKEKAGLAQLENSISEISLEGWLKTVHPVKVELSLPKFKMTSQFELGQTLSDMGMPSAFSPRADFSGIDGAHDLYISKVIHKAYVDVDEKGTEAAAATGVTMVGEAVIREKIVPFKADHPFIVVIRDDTTGSILFTGRVVDPSK